MHLTAPLFLLPLFFLPSTLAAPTNSTSPSTLSKRATYGWVSSYAPGDYDCQGLHARERPKVRTDCIKFSPASDVVGINWGTWPLSFSGLDIFRDENCKVKAGNQIPAPNYNNPTTHRNQGANTCFSVNKQANTGKIGSVRGAGVYFD